MDFLYDFRNELHRQGDFIEGFCVQVLKLLHRLLGNQEHVARQNRIFGHHGEHIASRLVEDDSGAVDLRVAKFDLIS